MLALNLSRLSGAKETLANISAFDPFQAGLFDLQMQYDDFQMLMTFMTKNEWPPNLSRQDQIYFKNLAEKAFQDTTHQFQLPIRKDCFQVKSNLLTGFRFTTHMNIMILN